MSLRPPPQRCPCGSGKPYADCCAPLHRGERGAATAEVLMRSRYSAYVLKNSDYLSATWHPSTRPASLDLSGDDTPWQRLSIIATEQGAENDETGYVEFAADYAGGQLHERSRFVKEEGGWLYLDGEILPPLVPAKVGRNEPCPCGSGRKFKRCCGT
jgi:SEC-C motif-containing protein